MATYIVSIFALGAAYFLRAIGDLEYIWQSWGGRLALLFVFFIIHAVTYLYIRGINRRRDA